MQKIGDITSKLSWPIHSLLFRKIKPCNDIGKECKFL